MSSGPTGTSSPFIARTSLPATIRERSCAIYPSNLLTSKCIRLYDNLPVNLFNDICKTCRNFKNKDVFERNEGSASAEIADRGEENMKQVSKVKSKQCIAV